MAAAELAPEDHSDESIAMSGASLRADFVTKITGQYVNLPAKVS
jgi:hypothetical protein